MTDDPWSLPGDLPAVRSALLDWFDAHQRPFPWRSVDDPYQLLVLEVMSQQTQLERVTEPWASFVDRWPTPADLAAASRADVVAFWSEHRLGYNRRAAYLHEAAATIVTTFDGSVPSDPDALQELPGVGPYTANAVASFAFGSGGPVIDTNVKRVLHRAFDVPDDDAAFSAAADRLAADVDIGRWNGAIMELGGTACGTSPRCDEQGCPFRRWCRAYQTGDFTAPDVPTQPAYEGSRRQYRGQVLRTLRDESPRSIEAVATAIDAAVDPETPTDRGWLRSLLDEMAADGLVQVTDGVVALPE